MKCEMQLKEGVLSFDVENSIGSLLGIRKILYGTGTYTSQKIVDIMGFKQLIFIVILYLELKILVKIQIYYKHLI